MRPASHPVEVSAAPVPSDLGTRGGLACFLLPAYVPRGGGPGQSGYSRAFSECTLVTRCLSSLGKKRIKVHHLEIMHKYFTVRGGEEAFMFTFSLSLGTPALAVPRVNLQEP